MTSVIGLGQHQALEYDKVLTNQGKAYDSRHGHFVAPYPGMYMFSFSTLNNQSRVVQEMVKNGNMIAVAFTDGSPSKMGSQTVIIHLNKSDMVWVRHQEPNYTSVYNSAIQPCITFSGVMLYED